MSYTKGNDEMFELKRLKGDTYFISMPTNIGLYRTEDNGVYIIDTGINEKSGRQILSAIEELGFTIKAVILTHAHTDHAGGCKHIVETTGCKAYATEAERIFVEYPDLEPAIVYGAFPCRDFRGKFMNTPACEVGDIKELYIPNGMEIFHLPGHFADMIGVKTPDDVYFVADSVIACRTLEKSPMSYIFDLESHYKTLEKIKAFDGKLCVPSHAEPTCEIGALVEFNKSCLNKVNDTLLRLLSAPMSVEDIAAALRAKWELSDTYAQYVMTCSEVRTHLTYLRHHGLINYCFENNRMLWERM